jgi:hypothetical protein
MTIEMSVTIEIVGTDLFEAEEVADPHKSRCLGNRRVRRLRRVRMPLNRRSRVHLTAVFGVR